MHGTGPYAKRLGPGPADRGLLLFTGLAQPRRRRFLATWGGRRSPLESGCKSLLAEAFPEVVVTAVGDGPTARIAQQLPAEGCVACAGVMLQVRHERA